MLAQFVFKNNFKKIFEYSNRSPTLNIKHTFHSVVRLQLYWLDHETGRINVLILRGLVAERSVQFGCTQN